MMHTLYEHSVFFLTEMTDLPKRSTIRIQPPFKTPSFDLDLETTRPSATTSPLELATLAANIGLL